MRKKTRQQYPQILTEVAVEVARLLTARGDAEDEAMKVGFEVAEFIRRHWAGIAVYIPRGQKWFLSQRDQEIAQEFNGSNGLELCRKYQVSLVRLYQIVKAVRGRVSTNAKGQE